MDSPILMLSTPPSLNVYLLRTGSRVLSIYSFVFSITRDCPNYIAFSKFLKKLGSVYLVTVTMLPSYCSLIIIHLYACP